MKSYSAVVEHLIDGEKTYFSFPSMNANSYSMAVAHFERMALSYPTCGIITKIEVCREVTEHTNSN